MKRFIVAFFALSFFAASLVGMYAYFVYIPEKVEKTVISGINRFGFENPTFSSLSREKGEIILRDVALDAERFSTIKELRIHFSLFQFLMNPDRAQNITVHDLKLTGELSDNHIPLIAGWADNAQIIQSLHNFPSNRITIDSASLDLLSEQFGGINIRGDGQINIQNNGEISIEVKATTEQKKLGFISDFNVQIGNDKEINLEVMLENILIDLPNISTKRGHGTIKGRYPYNDKHPVLSLTGNVQFASMNWHGLPLSDVTTSIKANKSERNCSIDGSTFGPEQIPWHGKIVQDLNADNGDSSYHSVMNISPHSLYDVQRFLGRSKRLGVNAYIPKLLLNIESPSIKIKNLYNSQKQNVIGTVEVGYKEPAVLLKIEYKSDPKNLNNIVGNIEMEQTVLRPTPETKDGTRFNLSALGNFTLRNYTEKPAFLWVAHTKVHNGTLDFGSVNIEKMRGIIFLGGSAAEQVKRKHSLNFSLPLKKDIEHKGTLFLNTNNIKKPLLERLSLDIYGGKIKTQGPITKDGAILKKNALDVSDVDLERLTHDAQLAGISVSGQLAGLIPYETKNEGIQVNGGLLQSQDTGVIRISRKISEGLFPGDTDKNRTLRKALENFHYEFFEIRLDGDLSDRVMMTLHAQGQNPDIKNKKPIDVNLQIETPISVLFKALMLQEE